MFRGRFIGVFVALLLIVGLFGLAGSSIYRAGWTQGYFVGKTSDGGLTGETTVVVPEEAPGRTLGPGHYGFFSAGSFFAGMVKFFFLFILIGMFFKFLGLLFWRKRGGWGHHRHWGADRGWGQAPPWYGDESDEPVMKA